MRKIKITKPKKRTIIIKKRTVKPKRRKIEDIMGFTRNA